MKKQVVEVGARFGKLTVLGFAGSDSRGNQLVDVRCNCPRETLKTVRLANLTFEPYGDKNGKWRQPSRSCGCESKLANAKYWEDRAIKLGKNGKKSLRNIWIAHQKGLSFKQLAVKFKLPERLVSAACRQLLAII